MKKKFLALLLVLFMVLPLVPVFEVPAFAAETSGSCGTSLSWSFSGSTLTITGSGAMKDFDSFWGAPWESYSAQIKTVKLPYGLTHVGDYAFNGCTVLTSADLPSSLTSIGWDAFNGCTSLSVITIPENVASIGYSAFASCKNVSTVYFNARNCGNFATSMNPFYGVGSNHGGFALIFGANVTRVPNNCVSAIASTTTLKSVTFSGNKVTEIGDSAFNYSQGLTYIKLPTSIQRIGISAFSHTGLTSALYCGTRSQWSNVSVGTFNDLLINALSFHEGHSFNQSTVTKKATCTQNGKRLWTCSVCKETKEETIDATGHQWNPASCTTPKTCATCGVTEGSVQHTWVDATCDAPKTCLLCGLTQGEIRGHVYVHACDTTCNDCGSVRAVTHDFSVQDKDTENHWMKCSVCGAIDEITRESHGFDNACDTTCEECGYVRTIIHSFTVQDNDAEFHWKRCSVCSVIDESSRESHCFDNACDTDCNMCGQIRTITHDYSAQDKDETHHWMKCSVCGNVDVSSREAHKHDNACDTDCNVCGQVRQVPDHVYENDRDAFCNECGHERPLYTPGDLDGKPGVDMDDAIYLLFAINFPESYALNQPVDFDGSGEVDMDDAIYLLFYVNFPPDYPLH